ncbi:hypothetical protein [Mucilaginibacter celer]|uniref:Nicotinamide mononucleotide transporter n=1 Tax=Mucilaginibacter celer TaxID=2305508 RepID=A0A494VRW8_9SPHI|nr:hypothetical protein [Mucilaginibacter celer]AYL96140.1 hypothetical protein HYN43_012935 [Mucilaginibacter celer]
MHYITINTGAELLCFFIGLFCVAWDKTPAWRVLLIYQFATCLIEFTGIYLRDHHQRNSIVYDIFITAECGTVSYFFYYLFRRYFKPFKLLAAWAFIFLTVYISEFVFFKHFQGYVDITASVISVVFVVASLVYYYLVQKYDDYQSLLSSPEFWWVNGVLFFYFGSTVSNIFFQYLIKEETDFNLTARYIIFNALNLLLYGCWSYAFICRYRQKTSFISSS